MHWREFQNQQRIAEAGDQFLSYVDAGKGKPVVFIHGIPTWGFLWHRAIEALQGTFRLLLPDLLGFGCSDKRDNFDRSIGRQAQVLNQWLENLRLGPVHIVAHDIGGGVALRLAALFPHRVASLSIMNTVCYDSWPIEMMLQFGHPSMYGKASASTTMKLLKKALKGGFESSADDAFLDGLLAPYSTEVGKLSLIRNAAALNTNLTTEITHLLPSIKAPSLILWGENDKFQLLKYGERLAKDIPGAKLQRVAQARHFVMIDQPAEVHSSIQQFLQQLPEK